MPRPGIADSLGAADQQQGVGIGGEDNGDRGPDQRIAAIVHHRVVNGQAVAKAVETIGQWLWL